MALFCHRQHKIKAPLTAFTFASWITNQSLNADIQENHYFPQKIFHSLLKLHNKTHYFQNTYWKSAPVLFLWSQHSPVLWDIKPQRVTGLRLSVPPALGMQTRVIPPGCFMWLLGVKLRSVYLWGKPCPGNSFPTKIPTLTVWQEEAWIAHYPCSKRASARR